MTTLPVIWVLMGLRTMPDLDGKWLPYNGPYQTEEACLAAKAQALNSERIHRSYLDCIPFKAVKQPRAIPTSIARSIKNGARPSATGTRTMRINAVPACPALLPLRTARLTNFVRTGVAVCGHGCSGSLVPLAASGLLDLVNAGILKIATRLGRHRPRAQRSCRVARTVSRYHPAPHCVDTHFRACSGVEFNKPNQRC